MVYFGFYNFSKLLGLARVLFDGLDVKSAAIAGPPRGLFGHMGESAGLGCCFFPWFLYVVLIAGIPTSASAVRSFVVATTTFISGQDEDDSIVRFLIVLYWNGR